MENKDDEIKKQIDIIQNQVKEIKQGFVEITGIVSSLTNTAPNLDVLNNLHAKFSKHIFSIEELGKKTGALFVNKNLYNDSTELSKYFYQGKLKIGALKDSFIAKDKAGYYKNLSSLNRTLDSSEYILSLFIGEITSELTKVIFKDSIKEKATNEAQNNIVKLKENIGILNKRMEKCEKKLSLLLEKHPRDFLDEDEAKVFNEIMNLHSQNVKWIEPRFLEKKLPLPKNRIDDILDDFLLYNVMEYKLRGGMKVYKYRDGEKNDFNKD